MKLSTLIRQPTNQFSTRKGFTLIELLIVIVIIATLAVTVFVALNPAQRIKDANNARRTTDVETVLTAIHAYIVDNKGSLPLGLPTSETQIGSSGTGCDTPAGCGTVTACWNAQANLTNYLASNPADPKTGSALKTRYSAVVSASTNIVTIKACDAEGITISASR